MSSSRPSIEDRILELLRDHGESGLRKPEIFRRLRGRGPVDARSFREALAGLERRGLVHCRRRGRYRAGPEAGRIAGRFRLHRNGYGFVIPEAPDARDVFIPPHATGPALPGDRVLVEITDAGDERGPVGAVRRILERARETTTGELVESRGRLFFHPLRRDYPELIPVEDAGGAPPGGWAKAVVQKQPGGRGRFQATIVGLVTETPGIEGDLDAVVHEFQLPPPYRAEQCRAAAARTPRSDGPPRSPVKQTPVITIDPEDAKDFDDALSIGPGERPGRAIVGVHIADVAAYVAPGGILDEWARERGFTAYLPGRTLPMLPEPLAAGRGSLREGAERLAHSVFLELDLDSGEILGATRRHTMVRVDHRLAFREVSAFFERGEAPDSWPAALRDCLSNLRRAARALRARRARSEQFLDLAVPEVRVRCGERPARILGLERAAPSEAHALVEEFMLAANEAVAAALIEREIPGIFRTHSAPKPHDLAAFRDWARRTAGVRAGRVGDRAGLNQLLRALRDSAVAECAAQLFLRVLPRAEYSGKCGPHFGLGKERYCHFTSPIRRYPDLLVHQQLWEVDTGRPPARTAEECGRLAAAASEQEQQVDEAYRAASDRLKLRYVRDRVRGGETPYFEAVVMKVERRALVLFVAELGLYASLPVRALPKDRYVIAEDGRFLRGLRRGWRARPGDVIFVEPDRVDLGRGVLEMRPLQPRV